MLKTCLDNEIGSKGTTAFTLAEVLITLAIIGVVAALTIPVLMNYFQEQAYINQFKKFHTELAQSYLEAANENGAVTTWADGTEIYNNMKSHFKIIKDCGYPTFCTRNDYLQLNKKSANGGVTHYNLILADGAIVQFMEPLTTGTGGALKSFFDDNVQYAPLMVDVNGLSKPNQMGADVFFFSLTTRKGSPTVIGGLAQWNLLGPWVCDKDEMAPGWWSGGSCGWWVYRHSNMDYLHRQVPDPEWSN